MRRFLCAGIRCRDDTDTARSAQRGKNLKGLAAVESKYSILEAARELGRSKSTLKYQVKKLPPETISKDEAGRIWISADGLELLRGYSKIEPVENQSLTGQKVDENSIRPDKSAPLTGRKPDESTDTTRRTDTFDQTKADVRPVEKSDSTAQTDQLDTLRRQLDDLRADLSDARQAAAVATAERDAERRRADAAELREQQHAQTVSDLTAALQNEQKHTAEITEKLTAALAASQALTAGQIQLAMQQSEPAAVTAEPADDQTGDGSDDQSDTGSARTPNEHRDTAADQQQPGDDQSTGKRRGFFARLFGKR